MVKSYLTEHPEVSINDAITRLAVQTEILQPMEDLEKEFACRFTAAGSNAPRVYRPLGCYGRPIHVQDELAQ